MTTDELNKFPTRLDLRLTVNETEYVRMQKKPTAALYAGVDPDSEVCWAVLYTAGRMERFTDWHKVRAVFKQIPEEGEDKQ